MWRRQICPIRQPQPLQSLREQSILPEPNDCFLRRCEPTLSQPSRLISFPSLLFHPPSVHLLSLLALSLCSLVSPEVFGIGRSALRAGPRERNPATERQTISPCSSEPSVGNGPKLPCAAFRLAATSGRARPPRRASAFRPTLLLCPSPVVQHSLSARPPSLPFGKPSHAAGTTKTGREPGGS